MLVVRERLSALNLLSLERRWLWGYEYVKSWMSWDNWKEAIRQSIAEKETIISTNEDRWSTLLLRKVHRVFDEWNKLNRHLADTEALENLRQIYSCIKEGGKETIREPPTLGILTSCSILTLMQMILELLLLLFHLLNFLLLTLSLFFTLICLFSSFLFPFAPPPHDTVTLYSSVTPAAAAPY